MTLARTTLGLFTGLSAMVLASASVAPAGEKPAVTWQGAASDHQRSGRDVAIDRIVIHTVEGSLSSAVNTFREDPRKVSAHYIVGRSGAIVQCVLDKNVAFHCAAWNERSIGIEHEGFANRAQTWTDANMRASASLTRWLCDAYRIPIDRAHIVGHVEVPGATHGDPGRYFDWDLYMALVRGSTAGMPPAAAADPVTASSAPPKTSTSTSTPDAASAEPATSTGGSAGRAGATPTATADATTPSGGRSGSRRGGGGGSGSRGSRSRADDPVAAGADAVRAGEQAVSEAGALDPATLRALADLDAALANGDAHAGIAIVDTATDGKPAAEATAKAEADGDARTGTPAAVCRVEPGQQPTSGGISSALDKLVQARSSAAARRARPSAPAAGRTAGP